MHFIEELIAGIGDKEHVHRRFVRYGRGEFPGAAIGIKKDGANLKISASEDYANTLGEIIAAGAKETFSVSGNIISRDDVSSRIKSAGLDVKKSAKKKGVYAIQVAGTLSGDKLSSLYTTLESAHLLLELKSPKASLKCKKNLPKPSGGVDDKFCSANLPAEKMPALLKEICCDPIKEGVSEVVLEHTYVIQELAVPEKYKNDYANARIMAKRKGVLKRSISAGGQKTVKEHAFSA